MSSSNCCFLTCIQAPQEAGRVVWYSHLFQKFPVYFDPHSQRLLQKEMFSWNLLAFFKDPADVQNLSSASSVFSKTSLNIWKLTLDVLLKPGLENFEHYFSSMWDECNCMVVWAFGGIAFLWDWNENWHFPVLSHCWDFQISIWHIEFITSTVSSSKIWNSSTGIKAIIESPNSLVDTALPLRINVIHSHLL